MSSLGMRRALTVIGHKLEHEQNLRSHFYPGVRNDVEEEVLTRYSAPAKNELAQPFRTAAYLIPLWDQCTLSPTQTENNHDAENMMAWD